MKGVPQQLESSRIPFKIKVKRITCSQKKIPIRISHTALPWTEAITPGKSCCHVSPTRTLEAQQRSDNSAVASPRATVLIRASGSLINLFKSDCLSDRFCCWNLTTICIQTRHRQGISREPRFRLRKMKIISSRDFDRRLASSCFAPSWQPTRKKLVPQQFNNNKSISGEDFKIDLILFVLSVSTRTSP